jgi:hypothetical protein
MKLFTKVATVLAVAAVITMPLAGRALAVSEGQIDGGNQNYEIKNLTQNVAYANPASANACDLLEYKVRLYNPGPASLYQVNVVTTLPSTIATSNTATLTASSENADPASTNFTTVLNLTSAQGVSYVNGTAQLLDVNNGLIENLPDGITQGGVNIGTLGPSTYEFVQFEAKVSCPAPAPKPVYTCNLLSVSEPAANEVQANVQYTAQNGAVFQNVTYNYGDGSSVTTTSTTTSRTYAKAGTYTVTATVNFSVNGTTQSATSANCAKTVSFTVPPTPTTTTTPSTPAPTTLVNTGPGDVIGIFGATTVVGAVAHRLFGRRLSAFFSGK